MVKLPNFQQEWVCHFFLPIANPHSRFQVDSKQLLKFHAIYGSLLKASMTSLRKRDKKRDKHRVEEAAKRKKQMTEPIVLDGNKRGSGRRQRQRKIKALLKQQESQRKFREREEDRK